MEVGDAIGDALHATLYLHLRGVKTKVKGETIRDWRGREEYSSGRRFYGSTLRGGGL